MRRQLGEAGSGLGKGSEPPRGAVCCLPTMAGLRRRKRGGAAGPSSASAIATQTDPEARLKCQQKAAPGSLIVSVPEGKALALKQHPKNANKEQSSGPSALAGRRVAVPMTKYGAFPPTLPGPQSSSVLGEEEKGSCILPSREDYMRNVCEL